jgi:hypothetical protein
MDLSRRKKRSNPEAIETGELSNILGRMKKKQKAQATHESSTRGSICRLYRTELPIALKLKIPMHHERSFFNTLIILLALLNI